MKDFIAKVGNILTSVRFWQVVGIAVVGYLGDTGVVSPEVSISIITVLGGSVAIGTIDKLSK